MDRLYLISFVFAVIVVLLLPLAAADDNYFFIKSNTGPYTALQGSDVVVGFTLANKDLVYPKDVKVYMDPCPVNWKCEEQRYSFDTKNGAHDLNLSVKIPDTALPKKYTMYLRLESDYPTTRGDDRLVFDVITEKDAKTLSYEEYSAKKAEPEYVEPDQFPETFVEPEPAPVPELYEAESGIDDVMPSETDSNKASIVSELVPDINKSEIAENMERLESSHQFVEYASVVLIVILVFIAAGAIITYRKDK